MAEWRNWASRTCAPRDKDISYSSRLSVKSNWRSSAAVSRGWRRPRGCRREGSPPSSSRPTASRAAAPAFPPPRLRLRRRRHHARRLRARRRRRRTAGQHRHAGTARRSAARLCRLAARPDRHAAPRRPPGQRNACAPSATRRPIAASGTGSTGWPTSSGGPAAAASSCRCQRLADLTARRPLRRAGQPAAGPLPALDRRRRPSRTCGLRDDRPLVGLLSMLLEDTVHARIDDAPLINGALGITIRGAGLTRAGRHVRLLAPLRRPLPTPGRDAACRLSGSDDSTRAG